MEQKIEQKIEQTTTPKVEQTKEELATLEAKRIMERDAKTIPQKECFGDFDAQYLKHNCKFCGSKITCAKKKNDAKLGPVVETPKIEKKTPSNKEQANGRVDALVKKNGNGQIAKDNSIAGTLKARLQRYIVREEALGVIIAKREKHIARLQVNLDKIKEALTKTERQHLVELAAIKELTRVFKESV